MSHACRGETGVGGGLKGGSTSYRGQREVCGPAGEEHTVAAERTHSEHTATTPGRTAELRPCFLFDCFTFTKVFFLSVLQLKCRLISLKKKRKEKYAECISRKKGVISEIKGLVKPTPTMLRSCVDGGLYEGGQEKKREGRKKPSHVRVLPGGLPFEAKEAC